MTQLETSNAVTLGSVRGLQTLTQQVYSVIKEAILQLKLAPGTPLVEEELAFQLGTSKTPVRDALLELERDGLVVRIPYKGTYVSEISEQDAKEIFELHAVLEGLAGRLAAVSFTPQELDQAEAILNAYDAALAAGDYEAVTNYGKQFHQLVIRRATNRRLLTILRTLDDQLHRLRRISSQDLARLQKSAGEHRAILAALRAGDPEQVEAAFRKHHHSVLNDLHITAKPGR